MSDVNTRVHARGLASLSLRCRCSLQDAIVVAVLSRILVVVASTQERDNDE